jgi:hypothetical protein
VAQKIADPFGIFNILFAARHSFYMLRVYDQEFDVFCFQQVDYGFPKHACTFHGHRAAAVLF